MIQINAAPATDSSNEDRLDFCTGVDPAPAPEPDVDAAT